MNLRAFCFSALLLIMVACSQPTGKSQTIDVEPYLPSTGAVAFELEPIPGGNGSTLWMAVYSAKGKTARFMIEFGPTKLADAVQGSNFAIKSGSGRFVSVAGSDDSALLQDLKVALEAKAIPSKVHRASSILFTFVILGEQNSQETGGGFNDRPLGHWTATKLFLGEGQNESEVFFNFNEVTRKGEFSIKDSDYGDLVLSELAKVL